MAALETYILVIGLGPAGGAAAASAAAAGLRVIAIDRKELLGEPVQCAEFVPLPLAGHAREDARIQSVTSMNTHLPSGAVRCSQFPGLMVDRAAFDRSFAVRAEKDGATILPHTQLAGLDVKECKATIIGPEGARMVRYMVLVAADGPQSMVASFMRLPPLQVVQTRQYTVPLKQPTAETEIWLSDEYPGGYAWLFPKGEIGNLGLGTDRRFAPDMKRPLEHLRSRLCAQGVIGEAILSRTGGAIPVGGLRSRLVHRNIVFVGDAAGLTHPITGSGIAPAVISGERAGNAAADFVRGDVAALDDYEADMRDQFEESLKRAVTRRRELEQHWRNQSAPDDSALRRGWIAFEEYFAA